MTYHDIRYHGFGEQQYPVLTVTVEGVHDVGRILATLNRGNVEHADLAGKIATEMRTSRTGRATLAYLESHGGPRLGHDPNRRCSNCDWVGYIDPDVLDLYAHQLMPCVRCLQPTLVAHDS